MTSRRTRVVACLAGSIMMLTAGAGTAATVSGKRLRITVSTVGKSKIYFASKDISVDSGNLGSTGDPRCAADGGGGGALRLNDHAGNDLTIPLPCAGWTNTNGGPGDVYNTDYRYRDPTKATCSRVVVKHGRTIKLLCQGPQVVWTLGMPEGDIDVTLRLGSLPIRNCATFGPPPTQVIRDGSDGRTYRAKNAEDPPACTSSPSGAFL